MSLANISSRNVGALQRSVSLLLELFGLKTANTYQLFSLLYALGKETYSVEGQ
jgi:hypothetical protein